MIVCGLSLKQGIWQDKNDEAPAFKRGLLDRTKEKRTGRLRRRDEELPQWHTDTLGQFGHVVDVER